MQVPLAPPRRVSSHRSGLEQTEAVVATDRDDTDAQVHSGHVDSCDAQDEDCDGQIEEDPTNAPTWYADADNDGYTDGSVLGSACDAPDGSAEASDADDRDGADATTPDDGNMDTGGDRPTGGGSCAAGGGAGGPGRCSWAVSPRSFAVAACPPLLSRSPR